MCAIIKIKGDRGGLFENLLASLIWDFKSCIVTKPKSARRAWPLLSIRTLLGCKEAKYVCHY